jgi:GTPase involved in cell partitioning and DNA repair
MNYLISLFFILSVINTADKNGQSKQEEVLQTVFNIEEFQDYLAYSPRFISTNSKQEVLMMKFAELGNQTLELNIRDKSVRIITEKEVNELKHNFFIKIDEFVVEKSTAKVVLSYQNARLFYERGQKILLDSQLDKNKNEEWEVSKYKLYKVDINTSD